MTTPTRYRRKPKVIDVLVWTGDNLDDVAEFLDGYVSEFSVSTRKGPRFRMSLDGSYGARLWVTKSQAWCDVNLGDGIAQETDGSGFYPIAADRLGEDFDPADEQPTTDQPGDATWQIGQVKAWGWRPAVGAAPVDCTGECGDGECNCSGEYRVLSWAPPGDGR